ncbi:MAG TPA: hypothetical protein VLA54_07290 [Acidimicrobiia bacterium]|nr:hypothetical protein [Acidimicrobiia bacterium]
MTDPVLEGNVAPTVPPARADLPPQLEPDFEAPIEHTAEFDACVEDIRRRYGSDIPFPIRHLEDLIRRRLGVAPLSGAAAALAGLLGIGIRLGVALLATVLVGDWAGIPWGRWMPILVFYCLLDATARLTMPPLDVPASAVNKRAVDDYMALLPTIVRESDLQDLDEFTRRRYRPSTTAVVGVAVAAIMLLACWWFSPTALGELPPGSIVLLGFVLYDFGAVIIGSGFFEWLFKAREARYDHHLFWPSPVDSPEVQKALGMTTVFGITTGFWITIYLVLALVLVGWGSPLVPPIAVGFIVLGYLTTIGQALGVRANIKKIVQRERDRRLRGLQHRIDAFGPRYTHLSLRESEQLGHLIDLHDRIRDAPTTPTTTRTVMHAAVALIIPTIMFVVTVFGEVYAERVLDAILP